MHHVTGFKSLSVIKAPSWSTASSGSHVSRSPGNSSFISVASPVTQTTACSTTEDSAETAGVVHTVYRCSYWRTSTAQSRSACVRSIQWRVPETHLPLQVRRALYMCKPLGKVGFVALTGTTSIPLLRCLTRSKANLPAHPQFSRKPPPPVEAFSCVRHTPTAYHLEASMQIVHVTGHPPW